MKIRALLATALLTLTPTLLAAPAHAATLHGDRNPSALEAGDPITVGNTLDLGAGISIPLENESICSLGPILNTTYALTAKHCAPKIGTTIFNNGKPIGKTVKNSPSDITLIQLNPNVNPTPTNIASNTAAQPGWKVSKWGTRTGRTEGVVTTPITRVETVGAGLLDGLNLPDPLKVNDYTRKYAMTDAFMSTMCVNHGDSGAAVFNVQGQAIGVVSSTSGDCSNPDTRSAIVPLSSAKL